MLRSIFSHLTRKCPVQRLGISWCQVQYYASQKSDNKTQIIRFDYFDDVKNKNKESYLEMVNIFKEQEQLRRGHVEFIYSALKHMKEFGVQNDIDVYKALVDVFPKGKMIPQNIFQAEFMHYPKHQQCAIDLLEQMEENAVIPDWDMEQQLLNVFGSRGHPLRRYWRMMYWMPKFKNASPWPLPRPMPNDSLQIALLGIKRITSVDINTEIAVYKTSDVEDSVDDTWIVSGQSAEQRALLDALPEGVTIYVEGSFRLWLRDRLLSYFILRTPYVPPKDKNPINLDDVSQLEGLWRNKKKDDSVHQREDGLILGVCATGSSSRDSLLSWVRCIQADNPSLKHRPVLFTLLSPTEAEQEPDPLHLPQQSIPTN